MYNSCVRRFLPFSASVSLSLMTAAQAQPTAFTYQGHAVIVDNTGRVGIGTTTPLAILHAFGNQPSLRLQDDDNATSFALLDDSIAGQMRINKVADATISLIDFNPQIVNGTSDVAVRFFRETGTTGLRRVIFHSGNNSAATSAEIGGGGRSSVFQLDGGNFGIGTSTPAATLDVRGSIRLGSNGQLLAASGEENLGIIRGAINANGQVIRGSGFTSQRVELGKYRITFRTPFASTPTATANVERTIVNVAAVGMDIGSPTASDATFVVYLGDTESIVDRIVNFVVVGPR